jgi:hypothetical protein
LSIKAQSVKNKPDQNKGGVMKKRVLVVIWLLLCLSYLAHAQTWDPAKRLTYATGYSESPATAAYWVYVHVIWVDDVSGAYELYYKKSTDLGATWSAPMRLTWGGAVPAYPAIAVNGTTVHIVYIQGNEIIYRKSVDNGATWSRAQITWGMDLLGVTMAVSGNNIHLAIYAWPGMLAPYPGIFYKRSTDNGETWSGPMKLGDSDERGFAITASGANVHIVYTNEVLHWGHEDMYYRKSTDNGATWNTPLQLASFEKAQLREDTDSEKETWYPSITSSGANVHVFYVSPQVWNTAGSDLVTMSSMDNGITWGPSKRLTWDGGVGALRSKASAADGANVYVTYLDTSTIEIYFKKSSDCGATWSAPTRLTYFSPGDFPSMIYSPGTGYFHIVFSYYVDNIYRREIYYKRGK